MADSGGPEHCFSLRVSWVLTLQSSLEWSEFRGLCCSPADTDPPRHRAGAMAQVWLRVLLYQKASQRRTLGVRTYLVWGLHTKGDLFLEDRPL
jgi:hypothetical protein